MPNKNQNKGSEKKPKRKCWPCGEDGHSKNSCLKGKNKSDGNSRNAEVDAFICQSPPKSTGTLVFWIRGPAITCVTGRNWFEDFSEASNEVTIGDGEIMFYIRFDIVMTGE